MMKSKSERTLTLFQRPSGTLPDSVNEKVVLLRKLFDEDLAKINIARPRLSISASEPLPVYSMKPKPILSYSSDSSFFSSSLWILTMLQFLSCNCSINKWSLINLVIKALLLALHAIPN